MKNYTDAELVNKAKEKILEEAEALKQVASQVDEAYAETIKAILECKGRLIITGLGKTGHVSKKIAASFASLGVPAFFLNSGESRDGGQGKSKKGDVFIIIFNTGKYHEKIYRSACRRGCSGCHCF